MSNGLGVAHVGSGGVGDTVAVLHRHSPALPLRIKSSHEGGTCGVKVGWIVGNGVAVGCAVAVSAIAASCSEGGKGVGVDEVEVVDVEAARVVDGITTEIDAGEINDRTPHRIASVATT